MKKLIMFAAVAGLVLALAPTAQAVPVTVANHSFELPWKNGGTGGDPDSWNIVHSHSDAEWVEGRWKPDPNPGGVGSWYAGPTDGNQILMFGQRSWENQQPTSSIVSQNLGTLNDLGIAALPSLAMQIDARAAAYNDGDWNGDIDGGWLSAYFTVNGSQVGTAMLETYGAGMGFPARTLPKWSELGIGFPPPDPPLGPSAAYMGHFTATLDASGLNPATDVLGIAIQHYMPVTDIYARACVDNVRVDAIPEPATMALLAFGGLGVLLRRKRR